MKKNPHFVAFVVTLLLGIYLWAYSDKPPYGYPMNEISNYYWGLKIDIAHKWRDFDFSFWDRGAAGGTSLFTSGVYPILNPLNFTAWFLNDDAFHLFHIIFPYLLGFYFTTVILLEFFKLPWPFAVFGGLTYMGLLVARGSTITGYPFFVWGCSFFPLLVYVYAKLLNRNFYLRCAALGAVVALQFASQGVYHVSQIFVWSAFLISIEALFFHRDKTLGSRVVEWLVGGFLLTFCSFGIFAVQFLPTYYYVVNESARVPGTYPINSLAIYDPSRPQYSLIHYFQYIFSTGGIVSSRGIVVLFLALLALVTANTQKTLALLTEKPFFKYVWLATLLYVVFPTAAFILAQIVPVFAKVFAPMTRFTFSYGVYVLDLCLAITASVLLAQPSLKIFSSQKPEKAIAPAALLILAGLVAILPIAFSLPVFDQLPKHFKTFELFMLSSWKSVVLLLTASAFIIYVLAIRPKKKTVNLVFTIILLFLGLTNYMTSYNWHEKGKRSKTKLHEYLLDTPEMNYFNAAKGQYYFPTDAPNVMGFNYGLLRGVESACGFLNVPPLRLVKFTMKYHADIPTLWTNQKFYYADPAPAIADYFPFDFTAVVRERNLGWPQFHKAVAGKEFDIWVRSRPAEDVYFAHQLKVLPFLDIVHKFDEPRSDTVFVEEEDAKTFNLTEQNSSGRRPRADYSNFVKQGDRVEFDVNKEAGGFVVVPDMFRDGWKVLANGKPLDIFPAYYLFIGFFLPGGENHIVMRYKPPLTDLGAWVSLAAWATLAALILWDKRTKKT